MTNWHRLLGSHVLNRQKTSLKIISTKQATWRILLNHVIMSKKTTKRIPGAVTLLSKDCTGTFIPDLRRSDSVLSTRHFFSGVLGKEKGLLQGDG